ncbi:MAG TPA: methyltransferase [Hyphomicrobiaceae bacterium]|nr:methyltransferase [Hyphomicrobiaceae bacterium]
MSRWAKDPDAAADALIGRSLEALDLSGRILIANSSGGLPAMLAARGLAFQRWDRRLGAGGSARPWPPPGAFDVAIVRLARAKDEQEMVLHAVLSVLAPDARLFIYGGNDEGIRSAATVLGSLCNATDTIARRGHGRLLAARRPRQLDALRGELADWRRPRRLSIAGQLRDWVSYPGLFAADRIDEGTELIIGTLPSLPAGARVADFGCGSGVIAAALATAPDLGLDLIDHDSVALLAAKENVPIGQTILASSLGGAAGLWDAILSNPPLHAGMAESHAALTQLIVEAPAHLRRGGLLQLVLQRRLPVEDLLARHLGQVRILADNGRYRVWSARRD